MIFVNVSRLLLLQLLLAAAMAVTVTFVASLTGLRFYDGSYDATSEKVPSM